MPEEVKPAAPAVVEEEVNKEGVEAPTEVPTTEESPYKEELEQIEAERKAMEERFEAELASKDEEKKRLMAIKDKAIEDEKGKTKSVKEAWKQEALSEMDRRLEIREARSRAASLTDDPTAHKVIMHHYENLPESLRSKSLDPEVAVEENLQTALALANRKRVGQILNEETMNDNENRRSIASMGGGNLPGSSSFATSPSATAKAASRLASAFAGKDRDLAKKLTDRVSKR